MFIYKVNISIIFILLSMNIDTGYLHGSVMYVLPLCRYDVSYPGTLSYIMSLLENRDIYRKYIPYSGQLKPSIKINLEPYTLQKYPI